MPKAFKINAWCLLVVLLCRIIALTKYTKNEIEKDENFSEQTKPVTIHQHHGHIVKSMCLIMWRGQGFSIVVYFLRS